MDPSPKTIPQILKEIKWSNLDILRILILKTGEQNWESNVLHVVKLKSYYRICGKSKIQKFFCCCCQIFVILRRPLLTALQHTVSPVTIDLLYTDCKATGNRCLTVISTIFILLPDCCYNNVCCNNNRNKQQTQKKTNATINNFQKIFFFSIKIDLRSTLSTNPCFKPTIVKDFPHYSL